MLLLKPNSPSAKSIKLFMVLIALIFFFPGVFLYAQEEIVTVNDILSNPKQFDGKEVRLRGEVVQFKVKTSGGYFIQLNDDPYVKKSIAEGSKPKGTNCAISVFVKDELSKKIKYFGSYRYKGDVIEITGKFNVSCSEHSGETDVHADSLKVLKRGYPIKHPLNIKLLGFSIALFLISTFVLVYWEYKKKQPEFRREKR